MHKVYINLDGTDYRMEVNWHATAAYCARKGVVNLTDIDNIGKITIPDVLPLAHCCITEGERLDGRVFEMSEDELGTKMLPKNIAEFIRKYAEMTTPVLPNEPSKTDGQEVKKKS